MIDKKKVEEAIALLLAGLGEDGGREGLQETPRRIARMYEEIFAGMEDDAAMHLGKTFAAADNEMVVMRDIVFYSVCEHHLMPFFGQAHVAYIPDGRVVGLSKLARTVEVFARRLQLQEQMTAQIAEAIMIHLQPKGVMVMVEAEHLCVTMRGVMKPGNQTITTVMKGAFIDNERLQGLFFKMVKG
ncbi:MAG: GTP cyclohydrolase I FolE [Lachnospiraceae bacterium]|jgi:GTP cyclohydrolase I|nr:GTP cyclohydrolase I FolE [Lachnospiraceae bacterium]